MIERDHEFLLRGVFFDRELIDSRIETQVNGFHRQSDYSACTGLR